MTPYNLLHSVGYPAVSERLRVERLYELSVLPLKLIAQALQFAERVCYSQIFFKCSSTKRQFVKPLSYRRLGCDQTFFHP